MAGKKIIISLSIFLTIVNPAIQAQIISFTGKVVDTRGNPVVSASLKIINSNQGTSSDSLGIFKLRIRHGSSVLVSAIGYGDTVFYGVNRAQMLIVLQPKAKALQEVVVSGANQPTEISSPEEIPREQIITSTFESYLREAEFSNGIYVISKAGPVGISRITLTGFGSLNTLNSGVTLPVVEHKEDTKGSRYLLNRFSRGLIVDQNNQFITDSNNLLNYDKIDGKLMIAQDGKNYLEVDKEKVIAFAFRTADSSYVFLNVPILSKTSYFLLIANGPKYSIYKSIKTKFVKSTYVSNGLVETGNNYDEYVDDQTYYWINQKENRAGMLELKKKSIKDAFAMETEKANQFFTKHKFDNLDDGFLRNFINYLNQ